jgi:dihydroorotate dehydrogenase
VIGLASKLALPLLLRLDPETAHGLSIAALKLGLPKVAAPKTDKRLAVKLAGLTFPNPLGMAAGYDKNGEAPDALLSLGFGFVEVGSITPRPQSGNPTPRIFRLPRDGAVINRLGFNNGGHDACHARLAGRVGRPGIVGINIGANKDSVDRAADYELGVRRFAAIASYLTINVSSPNTPGLRNMQARAELGELLTRVLAARDALPAGGGRATPIFLKIAPDLTDAEMEDIAEAVLSRPIEGLIVSNTTIARPALHHSALAAETGGLSGRPLFAKSTVVLARMRRLVGPHIAIIGVGGVSSVETALEKIRAGADLVQLYTGMIYGGPSLPSRIVAGMQRALEAEKVANISALRGTKTDFWAEAAV